MRIFISSTCYDLIDLRSEIEEDLKGMGLEPLLSDSPACDFRVLPDQNSINSCLANVRGSDAVLVILSQRYGPLLTPFGQSISATHLEYQEAVSNKRPVHFYVRDRLMGDFDTWRGNKKSPVKLQWVKDEEDYGLFHLIEERRKQFLDPDHPNNWIKTYRTSGDLKRMIRTDIQKEASEAIFFDALRRGLIPAVELLMPRPTALERTGSNPRYRICLEMRNTGGASACLPEIYFPGSSTTISGPPYLLPSQSFFWHADFELTPTCEWTRECKVSYSTTSGHRILDTYNPWMKLTSTETFHLPRFASRKITPGNPPRIELK